MCCTREGNLCRAVYCQGQCIASGCSHVDQVVVALLAEIGQRGSRIQRGADNRHRVVQHLEASVAGIAFARASRVAVGADVVGNVSIQRRREVW